MASPIRNSEWLAWVERLVSAAPGPMCAPGYPPDRFHCLLDGLPLHLVPQNRISSLRSPVERREELFVDPSCQFLSGENIPAELDPQRELLKEFALQGTIAWVPNRSSDTLSPFWLSPRLETVFSNKSSAETLSKLTDQDVGLLRAAGILATAESAKQHEAEDAKLAVCARMFRERGYAPISSLIHPFHVAALRRYYRYMIRNGKIHLGDGQSSRRFVANNDSVARFFHHQIARTVSIVAGEPVKPSYVYLASYLSGAELKKHTDREQCEFSVTLCLDFSPEPDHETQWPIRLETPNGTTIVYQALGDGLVYRGTRVPHYRDVLREGRTSTSIFFHYVPLGFSGPLN